MCGFDPRRSFHGSGPFGGCVNVTLFASQGVPDQRVEAVFTSGLQTVQFALNSDGLTSRET